MGTTITGRYHYEYPDRPCVYKLENKINGKVYIGSTIKPEQRMLQHRSAGLRYGETEASKMYTNHKLYSAIHDYGWDNFIFEIIEDVPNPSTYDDGVNDILAVAEQNWIDFYISEIGFDNMYNNEPVVMAPKRLSAEHKLKISEAMIGRTQTNEVKKARGDKVLAVNLFTRTIVLADTGKQLGDYFIGAGLNNGQACGKDIIKNKLKRHQLLFGEWFLYYYDKDKMMTQYDRMDEHGSYGKGQIYYKLLKLLHELDYADWSKLFKIINSSYDTASSDLETRDGNFVIHSRTRGASSEYNPTRNTVAKYNMSIVMAFEKLMNE